MGAANVQERSHHPVTAEVPSVAHDHQPV